MTKILVIEDDALLREEVVEWLGFEGYDVFNAENGILGVESAFRHLPNLIVCDITMPRLDGYGVLLEIRTNPATAGTPFIFLTARAAYEEIRQGMASGADDYITKPFTHAQFMQAVRIRLEKKAAQEQNLQREIEQLEEALAQEHEQRLLKAKFVAMFAHDFRNPLASILSSNGLLHDFADRMDEKRRLLHRNRIDASVHQLLQMLDEMLMLAQMESGKLEFKPEPLNVEQFFQRIVEEFQTLYGEMHLILFESRCTDVIMADPRLLHQIATNLISNAVKYSSQGSEVRLILDKHEGQFIFIVQDQGAGIPDADQKRLFDAFERGSNVSEVSGTGLGLAIVKQAVELHGGFVQLESELGIGTTITVVIPSSLE